MSNSASPWTAAHQASLSITNSWSLVKLMSIESVMTSNHLIFCHPLLPSIFPSIRVFSNESVLHIRWPKYWSFSISPSNEYSGLISFRIGWFDLFARAPYLLSFFIFLKFIIYLYICLLLIPKLECKLYKGRNFVLFTSIYSALGTVTGYIIETQYILIE